MNNTVLQSKTAVSDDGFDAPDDELLPLRWSIPVWLVLAAASWTGVYFVASLFL